MTELFMEKPYWVKITERKDGLWSWETEERGATGFETEEDALAASQAVRASGF